MLLNYFKNNSSSIDEEELLAVLDIGFAVVADITGKTPDLTSGYHLHSKPNNCLLV